MAERPIPYMDVRESVVFKVITRGCCGAAGIIAIAWITALSVAASDGPGGVHLTVTMNSVAVAAIAGFAVVGLGGIVTREVIRAETNRSMDTFADRLADHLAPKVAAAVSSRTVVALHEYVSGELREQVEVWLGRGQTRAMLDALSVKANGTGNVASLRRSE